MTPPGKPTKAISENTSYAIVALLITLILWVIITGSKESQAVKMVQVDYVLPKNFVVVNSIPQQVAFRVTGPRLAIKRFTENQEHLTIDLSSSGEGTTSVRIHSDSITIPSSLRVLGVTPNLITAQLERVVSRAVPVVARLVGEVGSGYKVTGIQVVPKVIEIWGARSNLEQVAELHTEPVDVSGRVSSFEKETAIETEHAGLIGSTLPHVKVVVTIKGGS
ncbi:MAG: hypothetical protein IT289_04710 [Oligoflexia bacterium]|nr:hypothetical protein [Oligoflexia bacterium]